MGRYVIGVTGASGIILAKRTIEALLEANCDVELVLSKNALLTAKIELSLEEALEEHFVAIIESKHKERLTLHSIEAMADRIASGSFQTEGMIVVPCSMATLAALRIGLSDNLLRRAADVTLKERRPLILVPREAPLSTLHLENMHQLSSYGATILMPVMTWYHHPKSKEEMEDFIVGKILDLIKIPHSLYCRWNGG